MIRLLIYIITYLPYRRFVSAIKNPLQAQEKVLKKIISESHYLKYYQKPLKNKDDFKLTPIKEYSNFQPHIAMDVLKNKNQCVYGQILFFEKTSGTTSGTKLIPYTQRHLLNYLHLVAIWTHDILRSLPQLKAFKVFISLSSAFQQHTKQDQNKVMQSDLDYIPVSLQKIFERQILIPKNLKSILLPEVYDEVLLVFLLNQRHLEIISVWNPTYLFTYIEKLEKNFSKLIAQSNRFDLPEQFPQNLMTIWPDLKFISAWGDANSKLDFFKLQTLFPGVVLQKKGLLSTEFPASVTLFRNSVGHYPLVNRIYFEFLKDDQLFSLTEVQLNQDYTLVLSAPGGFHRYNTHDIVKIVDFDGPCPIFEFIGRDNLFSDLVGEKLSEIHVRTILENLSSDFFSYLKATKCNNRFYYEVNTNDPRFPIETLEIQLCENVHYNYARKIGQLDPIKMAYSKTVENDFYEAEIKKGKKRGDIKRPYLVR